MRIRYSSDIFRIERHGGVARYFAELVTLYAAAGEDVRIVAPLHQNALLHDTPHVSGFDVHWLGPPRLRQGLTRVVDGVGHRLSEARLGAGDVHHLTYFRQRPPHGTATLVTTVYDMIHERLPGTVGPRDRTVGAKRATCGRADLVLAISQQTADDLVELYGLDDGRVVVTPLGARRVEPVGSPVSSRPYLLYVGHRSRAYKNFWPFAEALARSQQARELALVCFGGGAPTADERRRLDALGLTGRVEFHSGDDGRLARCYADAVALVYPSLYEGFGLPPLEAMLHGTPVAAARAGAITEVVGGAGLLFDPSTAASIEEAVDQIASDDALRAALAAGGPAHAASFTWEATAAATMAAYRTAAS